jgi:hypothetical protein
MSDRGDTRSKYFEEIEAATTPHRERAFDYEKLAVDYTTNVFRTMTYLCGGALVALPAAVALFQVDIKAHKTQLVLAAGFFVLALLAVCVAQAFAFFVMARRSESEQQLEHQQKLLLGSVHYPTVVDPAQAKVDGDKAYALAIKKIAASNKWRLAGLMTFWISLGFFLAGCYFGAYAML